MGTRTLNDIHNDMKRLITAITSFEENEEGFRICERFCMTNIKHHRYLSVNSNTTKEAIKDLIKKFSIHGKYDVAKKFEELVDTFLSSFAFEQHPQYDLQWYLLTLLLELSKETCNSDLECLKLIRGEYTLNVTGESEHEVITEEIDWAEYLKEGQDNFFDDYQSDTESEWSNGTEDRPDSCMNVIESIDFTESDKVVCVPSFEKELNKLSLALDEELKSQNWLLTNIQNTWWNELHWRKHPVKSRFCDANLCEIWHKANGGDFYTLGTVGEHLVCRELLWMLYTPIQMVIFQRNQTEFSIRPDVSVPSLTTVAFNSILRPFCEYFSMIHEVEQFGIELYAEQEKSCKRPPLTYETYNATLRQHLMTFKNGITEIEKKLMRQDSSFTLLSLSSVLKKNLHSVQILYEVHKRTVSDWRAHPNWMCTSKLLSSLYFEIQNSHNRERTNICISLYLSSLTVYLNIIDTWLSEGRFEDWREEFIIARLAHGTPSESGTRYETFSLRPLDALCLEDPIMQFLVRKIQHIGQSIEFLVSLDRVTDIWSINTGDSESKRSLVDDFYANLEIEISKYSAHGQEDVSPQSREERRSTTEYSLYDEDMEKSIVQQLTAFSNPFFLKAFQDHLPPELLKGSDIDNVPKIQNAERGANGIFKRLERISDYVLPFRKMLENILSEILVTRYNGASRLVKNIMSEEYKLESHLSLMRSVYMMEAGHIMNKFYQRLFHEIETNQMWNNSYFLSCVLEEVLSQWWPDSSSRWSITVSVTHTDKVLIAVDNVTLHYAIGWPINIILNEETFIKYNEIFRFQLKLKWALWTLNNLRFSDLEGSRLADKRNKLEQFHIRRIESLRFCLLHAITSIHTYLSGQVLQNLSIMLEKSLMRANSLDAIVSVHNEYLKKVHEHCLLTPEYEDLMATINNLIEMCNHVRARWNYKKLMFLSEELNVLENSYNKYHTYLALALHNAVQNKDANYYDLMLQYQINTRNVYLKDDPITCPANNLGQSLLIEIAYQYLPPSGIPIQIPKVIHKVDWYSSSLNSENSLPNDITLNEYEQAFSYIRWYQLEESIVTYNVSPYNLSREVQDLIDDDKSDTDY